MDGSSDPPGSKKRKLAWSSAEESRLIELYRQFSLLWDNRLPDYYKKDQRQCALRAIASQMGDRFTVGNVRDKIKTLRDYYVKEKKREESKRKHNFRGYVPRWEHFASLEFLRHCTASSDPRDLRPNVPNLPMPPGAASPAESSEGNGGPAVSPGPGHHSPDSGLEPELSPGAIAPCPVPLADEGEVLFYQLLMLQLAGMSDYDQGVAKVRMQEAMFDIKHNFEPPSSPGGPAP
ncbi:uncharacterized protein LOC144157890 isoform X2 [Haemaphysalis longicornis]